MSDADLLTEQRRAAIAERLTRDGRVVASALAEMFRVSEDTVRRDLREMAAAGLCRRVYGGALPLAPGAGSLKARSADRPGPKAALGRALAAAVPAGALVFLDAGSTNLAVAEALPGEAGLTVVTNAPAIAAVLAEMPGIECFVLGGRLDPRTGACLGGQTVREAERFRPAVAIIGACGVDAEAGITAHNFEEAELKAAVAARSARILVAATSDKLGTAAPFGVAPADWIGTLFVEADCAPERLAPFAARGLAIVRAEAEAVVA
ncbi:DeoR family transcriptional regulator [Aureimonas endophytica]|uniref:DeoR family transcriptional regulator n=1 Tax=Aureimonas endophytica TaxID=2027858 RepID=A0A917EBB8_9HYPH|nr:DeoR/GlpR family DNA-binding transcription regulator [Aureimonas endophytica]GGE20956.1 DeoR family transcriptional regulator [Aureimonas endophytica]